MMEKNTKYSFVGDVEGLKIEETEYLGLACNCIYGNNVRYFLFTDIDTKDPEVLRLVCQEYARNGLSFFVLETRKGYHVISDCLLDLKEWYTLKGKIRKFLDNYYIFLVIRMSNKDKDRYVGYYSEFKDPDRRTSWELFSFIMNRFGMIKNVIPETNLTLQWVKYKHHELRGI